MTDKKSKGTGRRSDGGDRPPRRRGAATPTPDKRRGEKSAPAPRAEKTFEGERIAKVMARSGACSRRDAESWIAEGRVALNGQVLTSPAVNVREGDRIEVDGKPLAEREHTRLFLFHKPVGLVTSAKDPEGRDTVFAFLERRHPDLPRVVSVGRLDINTEGLLLLTNDGGLARTLELPATGWTRRYRVRAHGEIDQAQLDKLEQGVTVEGVDYAPIHARLDRVQGANAWISMSLREGKNREIKRVLEHLGLEVNRLIRVSFGPFQLGELGEGEVEEVRLKTLREQLGKGLAELAGVDFSSPSREPAEPAHILAEEARQRAQKRTRKHVTVLRAEREEKGEDAPRARIERSATSDRRGRAVAVEKIVTAKKREEEPATRNARRFRAERDAHDDAPRARREPRSFEQAGPRSRGRFDEQRDERDRGGFRGARPSREEGGTPRRAQGERPYGESAGRGGPKFDGAAGESRQPPRGRFGKRSEDRERSEFHSSRPPRREGEARPRKFEGDDRRRTGRFDAAPGNAAPRSRGRPPERREERDREEFRASRPPRRDSEGRFPKRDGEARTQAPSRPPRTARGERPGHFEGEGRGRPTRSGAAAGESSPRSRSRFGEQREEQGRAGARAPRGAGEARAHAPGKRPFAVKGEGRGKFERDDRRPRKSEGGARSDAKPRGPRSAYDANKPRGPRGAGKPGGGPRKPRGPR